MNILFSINHPAHVHFFRNAIEILKAKGNHVIITSRRKDITIELLKIYRLSHIVVSRQRNSLPGMFIELIQHELKVYTILKKYKVNIALSIDGTFIAHACHKLKIPLLVFSDTEFNFSTNFLVYPFASIFLTPTCYDKNLGSKQLCYEGFHEIAYLHPNYFTPDESVLKEAGIQKDERFFIVRKTSGKAAENLGQKLMNNKDVSKLIQYLNTEGKVLLSAEQNITSELRRFLVQISPEKMHSLIYYADLFVGDSLTMFTESALLGTPSISISSEGYLLGNFDEICQKYELGFRFRSVSEALGKIKELLQKSDIKEEWKKKRNRLLAEKRDVTQFQIDLIANYNKVRKNIRKFSC